MRAAHFGLFWHEVKERYPVSEERTPLDPLMERFPDSERRRFGLQLQALDRPPVPRFWFISEDKRAFLQLQTDRFIKNWRQGGEPDAYPRYEMVKSWFLEEFEAYEAFVDREKLGSLQVNQCEVTYVNHIVAGEGFASHEEVDEVFTVWRQPTAPYPGKAEDITFHARFPIRDSSGHPVGRLHADVQSAVRNTDGRPMFVFNLTARGFLGQATDFFDLGREWIVRSFAEMTTAQMHAIWRRT